MRRVEPDTSPAGERESLESWLDYHRATLLLKCDGLAADQLVTASCPPSELTLIGLVRHLTDVEGWFHLFDGAPIVDPCPGEQDVDPYPEHVDRDLASYGAAVERSRRAVAGRDLDELRDLPHWVSDDQPKEVRPTSLRWVFQHMVEEYARHNGHADLIRERIDGAVGA